MFYSLVERYSYWVADYEVSDFRRYGDARALVATITFVDRSKLFVRDYLFADGSRKYSFHWQTSEGHLRTRWDNSPHHQQLRTFPHHRHEPDGVVSSQEFTLDLVLQSIAQELKM